MNASLLKGECLAWLRYDRGFNLIATEAGRFSADVLAVSNTRIIEIETKISIADLRADFKKSKHRQYDTFSHRPTEDGKKMDGAVPTLFYFCLPSDLIPAAEKYLDGLELPIVKRYGLLSYVTEDAWMTGVSFGINVVRKAQKIHEWQPGDRLKEVIAARMSSELVGLHRSLNVLQETTANSMATLRKATVELYRMLPIAPAEDKDDFELTETPDQSNLQPK